MKMEMRISLARLFYPVKVLGPGNRVGIWLNGCTRECDGCISPELQIYDKAKEVSIREVVGMVEQISSHIDGFTISGGEPFFRPEALDLLVKSLAAINDDILIFTGYTLDELKAQGKKEIDSILSTCACLIDGPYIKGLNDNRGLRGSSNQKCWVFKHQEKYIDVEASERKLQTIIYGQKILTIGVPQGEQFL